MAPRKPTTKQLRTGLRKLPQELYDEIWNLTFSCAGEKQPLINKDYKPPSLLHVNRKSRQHFIQKYYNRTPQAPWQVYAPEASRMGRSWWSCYLLRSWLESLPDDVLRAISSSSMERTKAYGSGYDVSFFYSTDSSGWSAYYESVLESTERSRTLHQTIKGLYYENFGR